MSCPHISPKTEDEENDHHFEYDIFIFFNDYSNFTGIWSQRMQRSSEHYATIVSDNVLAPSHYPQQATSHYPNQWWYNFHVHMWPRWFFILIHLISPVNHRRFKSKPQAGTHIIGDYTYSVSFMICTSWLQNKQSAMSRLNLNTVHRFLFKWKIWSSYKKAGWHFSHEPQDIFSTSIYGTEYLWWITWWRSILNTRENVESFGVQFFNCMY